MMIKKITLLICLFTMIVSAQQKEGLKKIRDLYSDFNYKGTLEQSSQILTDSSLTKPEISEVYLLRAMSYYSLNYPDSVRQSFINLLKNDKGYNCSPSLVPPKVIALFNEVKTEYNSILNDKSQDVIKEKQIPKMEKAGSEIELQYNNLFRGSLSRSIILPGWGHLYFRNNTKGWLMTTASVALIGTTTYFAIKTAKAENEYLSVTDWQKFDEKYNEFNKFYKVRNSLIIAYAVLWVYAQADLLFNDDFSLNKYIQSTAQIIPGGSQNTILAFRIPLN